MRTHFIPLRLSRQFQFDVAKAFRTAVGIFRHLCILTRLIWFVLSLFARNALRAARFSTYQATSSKTRPSLEFSLNGEVIWTMQVQAIGESRFGVL